MSAAADRMPRSRAAPPQGSRRNNQAGSLMRSMLERPLTTLAIAISAGLAAAIVVNAVGLQHRAHPAPFFGPRAAPQPSTQGAGAAPPRQARAASPTTIEQALRDAPETVGALPATVNVVPPARPVEFQTQPVSPAAPSRDAIAELLRGEPARGEAQRPLREAAVPGPANPPAPAAPIDQRVAAAQRALTKLGYGPLKADGVMGIGTRLAIENFEKDRRLPLTGELTPRLAREISAASGIAID